MQNYKSTGQSMFFAQPRRRAWRMFLPKLHIIFLSVSEEIKLLAKSKRQQVPRQLNGPQLRINAPISFQSYRSDKSLRVVLSKTSCGVRTLSKQISLWTNIVSWSVDETKYPRKNKKHKSYRSNDKSLTWIEKKKAKQILSSIKEAVCN